jgi:hypothetical protein
MLAYACLYVGNSINTNEHSVIIYVHSPHCFYLLSLICPNRGFSMRYEESKSKNSSPAPVASQVVRGMSQILYSRPAALATIPLMGKP